MSHPMGEGVGLAGSGAGNDQQRRSGKSARGPVLDGLPLLGIEGFEVGRWGLHRAFRS